MESELERAQLAFRDALLRLERSAATDLVRAYADAWLVIRDRLATLLARFQAAREAGQQPGISWAFQQGRLQELLNQVEAEIARFAAYADATITRAQSEAIYQARAHAEQLLQIALPFNPPAVTVSFAAAPIAALRQLVGTLSDGSPLRQLLAELGPEASLATRRALLTGLVTGQNPRAIAGVVRRQVGMGLTRALVISRNETLRAYRGAALENYRANANVVRGWIWVAKLDERTCVICWARHGSIHPLEEEFVSHIMCRCSPIPLTASWAELGVSGVRETRASVTPGPDVFRTLSDERQRTILGPAAWQAYHDGELSLVDLVGRKEDTRWGPSLYRRPNYEVLASLD